MSSFSVELVNVVYSYFCSMSQDCILRFHQFWNFYEGAFVHPMECYIEVNTYEVWYNVL